MAKENLSKQIRIRPSTLRRLDKIIAKHPHFRYADEIISQMLDDREDAQGLARKAPVVA